MKIESAIKISIGNLKDKHAPDHVFVMYGDNDQIERLVYPYSTSDEGLYGMVKRRGGVWDKDAKMWTFASASAAQEMLNAIRKRHADWPILSNRVEDQRQWLAGVHLSSMELVGGKSACILPFPLSYFATINTSGDVIRIKLNGKQKKDVATMLVGENKQIQDFVVTLEEQGAVMDGALAKRWQIAATSKIKVKVKVSGWAVQIECDQSNPLHYLIMPEQRYEWDAPWPHGTQVAVPWHGVINTTRKLWPTWKAKIAAAGLEYEGDDPDVDIAKPSSFNTELIPGWSFPAKNGHMLHEYQKEGAIFCAKRGMRALIGDEMGIGKTAQAIAAAESVAAQKVLVICPANARYVWDREIKGWGSGGKIQHITKQLDALDEDARWYIATYDQLVSRAETWKLQNGQEEKAFLTVFPDRKKDIEKGSYPKKVSLSQFFSMAPDFADAKRVVAWQNMMRRLRGELLEQILAAGSILTIIDEAHRVKNRESKRTKAIQRITAAKTQTLLLTGTPLRNNEHEVAVLLTLLDAEAKYSLDKQHGYTTQDVKDYLSYFMIRRTKAEVLPELPEKTRQRIDIGTLDPDTMEEYQIALNDARDAHDKALLNGASEALARQKMRGGIERARTALGLAKIRGGEVADLVADIVENKECCVVFCAHHFVSDELMTQLNQAGIKSAVVDGRTPQIERARIEGQFQNGGLQVFIGGINAAGEAITLTRADTVVFVELDWVPAALMQAEDRIHRVGQKSNCQVMQLIAKLDGQNIDEEMISVIGSKLERIGMVLDEGTSNIIDKVEVSCSIQAEVYSKLLSKQWENIQQVLVIEPILTSVPPAQIPAPIQEKGSDTAHHSDVATEYLNSKTESTKRKRGRPTIYADQSPPSSTERSKRSVESLKAAGGKRLMLRLTPEGLDALKTIMSLDGIAQETEAINQALISRKQHLLRISTIND